MSRRLMLDNPRFERAKATRERFMDREAERAQRVAWHWPKTLLHVGQCEAVMYASDKWQERRGLMEKYKHIAESKQDLLVRPGFLRVFDNPNEKLRVNGTVREVGPMPEAFSVLAKAIGFQCRLNDESGRPGNDEHLYQVNLSGVMLGAAEAGDKCMLIFYDARGVHALVAGRRLRIEKDGIAG